MTDRNPATPDPQLLSSDELIIYEALATLRRPMKAGDLVADAGLDEETVRAALDRLTELGLIIDSDGNFTIGPTAWDVRGAR